MELNFIKNEATRYWECEFEATADFNLHIEGVPEGKVWIYQRTTASGEHAYIKEATPYPSLVDVYDFDFTALIYPKFVKVVCGTEPTYAEVVSNGEITELKYQEKSVEVTANGNTEVIPDAGFAGLTKVNVSVNVPQSGGGESGGGSTMEYWDISGEPAGFPKQCLVGLSILVKMGDNAIAPPGMSAIESSEYINMFNGAKAICIDPSLSVITSGQSLTISMVLSMYGIDFASLPRITEEEFYNLNA